MTDTADSFRRRLARSGIARQAIDAAWPEWWSVAADASPSALADAKFSVARKLGLDPRSLLDEGEPQFIWKDTSKYKNFTGTPAEQAAITSFGTAFARQVLAATPPIDQTVEGMAPDMLRDAMLRGGRPFVTLRSLLATCWGLGIPVIHLRIFPLPAKRMCAMAVKVDSRYAILLARDAEYPAPISFHLAHEIGHIALSHVEADSALIDMAAPDEEKEKDREEEAADRFALTLLTGSPAPQIQVDGKGRSSVDLAKQVVALGPSHRIEPGTLALCYGHATRDWPVATRALSHIYDHKQPVWREVNRTAARQLDLSSLSEDSASYVQAVMGGTL